jgi:hypothetical protein
VERIWNAMVDRTIGASEAKDCYWERAEKWREESR